MNVVNDTLDVVESKQLTRFGHVKQLSEYLTSTISNMVGSTTDRMTQAVTTFVLSVRVVS